MTRVVPINVAEAFVDIFHDPELSALPRWKVQPGKAHGLKVKQIWCAATFEWMRRPAGRRPALCMERRLNLDCSRFGNLLVCIWAPLKARVRVTAWTDRGIRTVLAPPAGPDKREVALLLRGAKRVRRIRIEVFAAGDAPASGWVLWVGLQDPGLLPAYNEQWKAPDPEWEGYLQPKGFKPAFTPRYGLHLDEAELREERNRLRRSKGTAVAELLRKGRRHPPEQQYGEFMVGYMDRRYDRERHHGLTHAVEARDAARLGLVAKNPDLMRLAARVALVRALTPNWEENPLSSFPGGIFEHRCFTHTMTMEDLCAALDMAGEMFTEAGRSFLLRRLAEEGLGRTNFIHWKHDYIFHNNQLAAFSPGRMIAYAVLEREWQHVGPYLDLAYRELQENFNHILLPDGGYAEGISYFCYGVGFGLRGLRHYARARKLPVKSVLPERLAKTGQFAMTLASTDDRCEVIAFGDAHPVNAPGGYKAFADAIPGSGWTRLHRKSYQVAGQPDPLKGGRVPDMPVFLAMPDWGAVASVRMLADRPVKIFVGGCTRDADHNHEDKGSFVLEFGGDTFALEPGGYLPPANPVAGQAKHWQLHNMFGPAMDGFDTRPSPRMPHPTTPLEHGIVPTGRGDARRFHAAVDATLVWRNYFSRWQRAIDSPSPDVLVIRDRYAMKQGRALEWHWNTRLPLRLEGRTAIITGRRGRVEIRIPDGWQARVEEIQPDTKHWPEHRRLTLKKEGRSGAITVQAHLIPTSR